MIADLLGRLHPALVHLPIGILLLGVCFELISGNKRLAAIKPAIPVVILWGMVAAILACVTGLALNSGGDYEEELVQPHQWSGIALASLSIILFVLYKRKIKNGVIKLFSLLTLILIFVSGHLGGTITHGENFLSFSDDESSSAPVKMKPIPDIQQAMLYTDVVQPLFQSRCYSCHGARKQKGKLRLDGQEFILKGGESGEAILPGKAEESEMIERLLLPLDDDDHMPPKGKPQLTKEQIDIVRWWVSTGADFHKRVGELQQSEQIKPVLLALQTGISIVKEEIEMVPEQPVDAADAKLVAKLIESGVSISPVARESNYLSASFFSAVQVDSLLSQLTQLKKQVVSLKLDGVQFGSAGVSSIAQLTALRKLQLSNTSISDESFQQLKNLKELRSLNLVGTAITAKGLVELADLKQLKYIYVYKTGITPAEGDELKKRLPGTTFDFGNYSLPMLEGDTTELKF